jgi:hypothetical protein
MALDATVRRRWFGGLVLLTALAMLVCGDTVLKGKMGLLALLVYWMVCFVLTGIAVLVAFRDLRAVQRRTRQEQRDLFENIVKKIAAEAKAKPGRAGRNGSPK